MYKRNSHATLAAVNRVVENLTSYFGSALNEGKKIGTPVHIRNPRISRSIRSQPYRKGERMMNRAADPWKHPTFQ